MALTDYHPGRVSSILLKRPKSISRIFKTATSLRSRTLKSPWLSRTKGERWNCCQSQSTNLPCLNPATTFSASLLFRRHSALNCSALQSLHPWPQDRRPSGNDSTSRKSKQQTCRAPKYLMKIREVLHGFKRPGSRLSSSASVFN